MQIEYITNKLDYTWRKVTCNSNTGSQIESIFSKTIKFPNLELIIIRDDKLCGGTKSRILRSLLLEYYSDFEEYVYISSNWYGGAQIALSWTINQFLNEGIKKKATIITIPFKIPIPAYPRIAKEFGAKIIFSSEQNIHQFTNKYISKSNKRVLLPSGFKTDFSIYRISQFGEIVKNRFGYFDEVWCAVGSGTLINGLQKANIGDKYYGVCNFRNCPDIGKAIPIDPGLNYFESSKIENLPPIPSSTHYDAKVWKFVKERRGKILWWNVL